MEDHYFEARMTGPDGAEITTPRQRTPQGAWADVLDLPKGATGPFGITLSRVKPRLSTSGLAGTAQ